MYERIIIIIIIWGALKYSYFTSHQNVPVIRFTFAVICNTCDNQCRLLNQIVFITFSANVMDSVGGVLHLESTALNNNNINFPSSNRKKQLNRWQITDAWSKCMRKQNGNEENTTNVLLANPHLFVTCLFILIQSNHQMCYKSHYSSES